MVGSDGEGERSMEMINGPPSLPLRNVASSPNYVQTNVLSSQWVNPIGVAPSLDTTYEPMVGDKTRLNLNKKKTYVTFA